MDLGEGAFSQVVLGQSKKDQNVYVAMKVVYLQSPEVLDDPEHLAILRKEAEFLQLLDHPNIVKCYEVVENEKQMVILMEWLRGGHLLDTLEEMAGQHYSEQQAAILFVQLAEALENMHSMQIIHRDIKAENIVFRDSAAAAAAKGGPPVVKYIDLGMSTFYDKDKPLEGAMGSPGFVSPEVIMHEAHTPAMDIYSLGVVLFIMLVGRKPYNIKEIENLTYCNIDIHNAPGLQDSRWIDLSESAKDLVLGMLDTDPKKRLTAKQVLAHSWVTTRGGLVPKLLNPNVARGAANVASVRRLRNLVHGAIALKSLRALKEKEKGVKGKELEHSVRARNEFTKRLNKRRNAESSLHSIALQMNGRALSKLHDAGVTRTQDKDMSVRSGRMYFGNDVDNMRGWSSVHGASRAKQYLLKPSGTALMLSEMAPDLSSPDDSWRDGDNMQTAFSAPSPVRLGRTSTSALQSKSSSKLLKNISTDLKDYMMTPSRVGDKSSDSLSSSPESSGRGRSNFLQRLSSTLRDRSNRGYKKDENSSSAQAREDSQAPPRGDMQPRASMPTRVKRVQVLKEDNLDSLSYTGSSALPEIKEGHREGRMSMDVHNQQHNGHTLQTPLMENASVLKQTAQNGAASAGELSKT
ncbi:g9998 [Coccomyxa viridis]|uniref:G9998 protein n=1 Tax=Coccomyxa viridis TaxID=1274662 RepID=A0ABP1G5N4_9CHLO